MSINISAASLFFALMKKLHLPSIKFNLCLVCLLTFQLGLAQEDTSSATRTKLLRDVAIFPVPVVFRFPETGWGGGVAMTSAFSFSRDALGSKPSQLSAGITYTQNKQILFFIPFNLFLDNGRYYINGDNGWFRYNFFYYGIGEKRVPEERFDVTFPRIRLLATKQIRKNMYAGVRFQFETYDVTKTAGGGELGSGRIAGSDYSRTISLGPALVRDTRDAVFYPRKGAFGEIYLLPTLKAIGADQNFVRLYADYSTYQSFGSKKWVWANNYLASFIWGKQVPFSQLSFLGGPKKMRGIYEGFFRDHNSLLIQSEWRWEVWKRLGLVGFGAMGWLGNQEDVIRLGKPKFTYGAGVRITGHKKNHLNIRLDYGLSPYGKGNFYATIGEAF